MCFLGGFGAAGCGHDSGGSGPAPALLLAHAARLSASLRVHLRPARRRLQHSPGEQHRIHIQRLQPGILARIKLLALLGGEPAPFGRASPRPQGNRGERWVTTHPNRRVRSLLPENRSQGRGYPAGEPGTSTRAGRRTFRTCSGPGRETGVLDPLPASLDTPRRRAGSRPNDRSAPLRRLGYSQRTGTPYPELGAEIHALRHHERQLSGRKNRIRTLRTWLPYPTTDRTVYGRRSDTVLSGSCAGARTRGDKPSEHRIDLSTVYRQKSPRPGGQQASVWERRSSLPRSSGAGGCQCPRSGQRFGPIFPN